MGFLKKKVKPEYVRTYEGQKVVNKTYCGTTRYVEPGDSIQAHYDTGLMTHILAEHKVTRRFKFDGIVIFNVENGEFDPNVVDGMGAAFVDTEGKGFAE